MRAIVVFASRESLPVLQRSIDAARAAAAPAGLYRIEVVVNGNPPLAQALAQAQPGVRSSGPAVPLRVWSIALGDKANAWSQYFHAIWQGEALAFFMDGYVRPNPDAAQLLGDAVLRDPVALGGSGVPTVGRTARALRSDMLQHGGFHGNFCCIKGEVIAQWRAEGFRLPVGLYRGDSLLGAVLRFGLRPQSEAWNPRRIHVHGDASWTTDAKRWWSPADLLGQLRRLRRQARGLLENEAVKHHFLKLREAPTALPPTADALIRGWAAACSQEARALQKRRPLVRREIGRTMAPAPCPDAAARQVRLIQELA
ncbi:MAG: hypothetical protein PGN26_06345 [Xylophilus ampelinus]